MNLYGAMEFVYSGTSIGSCTWNDTVPLGRELILADVTLDWFCKVLKLRIKKPYLYNYTCGWGCAVLKASVVLLDWFLVASVVAGGSVVWTGFHKSAKVSLLAIRFCIGWNS